MPRASDESQGLPSERVTSLDPGTKAAQEVGPARPSMAWLLLTLPLDLGAAPYRASEW